MKEKALTMKNAKMSSSLLRSGLLASGAVLLLAGCSPTVTIGSDIGSGSLDIDGRGSEANSTVNCHVKLENAGGGWGGLSLSNQDLTASTPETMDVAKASVGHLGGKWYFESHIDQVQGTWWAENVGAAVDDFIPQVHDTARMGATYNTTGSISTTPHDFGLPGGDKFETGDLVGVAIDLDGGRIYFQKNGVWQNGDPAAGTGGAEVLTLPGTGAYRAFLSVSENDQMTANFGESKFAYPVPAGFSPYAAGFAADGEGNCQESGPTSLPVDAAPLSASCSDLDSYNAGSAGGTELHLIGVYRADSSQINVQVDRKGPLVLVLSSYDAVQWNVTAAPGTKIQRIVMSSYEPSSVAAPPGISVDHFIFEQGGKYLDTGYAWPAASGGSDTQALIKNAQAETGLEMTSFGGCYSGGSFTLTN